MATALLLFALVTIEDGRPVSCDLLIFLLQLFDQLVGVLVGLNTEETTL